MCVCVFFFLGGGGLWGLGGCVCVCRVGKVRACVRACKRAVQGGGKKWGCTRYHLSFLRFPQLYSGFFFKIGHFPFKTYCFGSLKREFSGPKKPGPNGGLGVPRPQNHLAYKTRENVTTPQLASLHGLASNWANNCYKTGGKMPKGQMVPSRSRTGGGGGGGLGGFGLGGFGWVPAGCFFGG